MKRYLIVIYLFFCGLCSPTYAFLINPITQNQVTEEKLVSDYENLLKESIDAMMNSNITLAIEKYAQAELIAERLGDVEKLANIKSRIGYAYAILSSYGEAFDYYHDALKLIENTVPTEKLNHIKVEVLIKIGLVYTEKKDFHTALEYYKKAGEFLKQIKSTYRLKMLGLNIVNTYNEIGLHQEAKKKLEEINDLDYDVDGNEFGNNLWQINYAETLFLLGEIEESRLIAEKLYQESIKDVRNYCQACVLKLLSKIAEKNKAYDQAIRYSKLAIATKNELPLKIEQYTRLADLYLMQKDLLMVVKYKDSAMQAKDRLHEEINTQLFEVNKVKLRLNEYQNELKLKDAEYKNNTKILWIVIVGILLVAFLIYLWQRNRIVKQKQKHVIIESKSRIAQLELEQEKNEKLLLKKQVDASINKAKLKQENLKNKIAKKNRELTSNALYNSSRIDILNNIIRSLEKIKDISMNQELMEYIRSLKKFTNKSESWKEFTHHFEKVNPDFLQQLNEQHPSLTKSDVRFLCYIYMNLGTKEICIIFNITPEAFRKRKQRISDKLNLSKDENLYHYIQNIGNKE